MNTKDNSIINLEKYLLTIPKVKLESEIKYLPKKKKK